MKQVTNIKVRGLKKLAAKMYGDLVKGVIDLKKRVLVIDAEMHVDIEQYFLENGSEQNDLWGINLHPDKYGTDEFIQFDSMINIRPSQNNRSRYVENSKIREKLAEIVESIVTK